MTPEGATAMCAPVPTVASVVPPLFWARTLPMLRAFAMERTVIAVTEYVEHVA
jgi:hypothetical protein